MTPDAAQGTPAPAELPSHLSGASRPSRLLARLQAPGPLVSVELRPPRTDLGRMDTMDAWIDLHHGVQRLVRGDRIVFFTDSAVGVPEEENLSHLSGNLGGDVEAWPLVPFLTTKHPLEYCLLYARRAWAGGVEALTVLGGDRHVGPPRCVPFAKDLRRILRQEVPGLALGGWANPARDPAEQAGFLAAPDVEADFFLTQVVSHHDLAPVEAFLSALREREVTIPGVFGVFFYRSANPRTLQRLSSFLPVPMEALTREFGEGASAEEVCARTLRGLRDLGAEKVYISNLGTRRVERTLDGILARL